MYLATVPALFQPPASTVLQDAVERHGREALADVAVAADVAKQKASLKCVRVYT